MKKQEKITTQYCSSTEIDNAFIETIMRIQKSCKTNQDLARKIEEYFNDKTKFYFTITRFTETSE